jgi:hypothetical protein
MIHAMRGSYWKLRDPNLINRDKEIVSRECSGETSPAEPVWPGSPTRERGSQTRATPSTCAPDERETLQTFLSEITRSPDRQVTR